MARADAAPTPADLTHLRPTDAAGLRVIALALGGTALALLLSFAPDWRMWIAGQILLGLLLVQWFVILHECGHETLFRTRKWHAIAGRLAADVFADPLSLLDTGSRPSSQMDRLAGSRSNHRIAHPTRPRLGRTRPGESVLAVVDPAVLCCLPRHQLLEHLQAVPDLSEVSRPPCDCD